jgi:lysozyme family protein
MAGSRLLIVIVLALLAFVAVASVSADDTGSSITTPIAQSPVGDFEGDAPVDSATDEDAEAPDAGSLGAPVSSTGSSDSSTEKTPMTSASSTISMAGVAIAATGVIVGYFAL